MTILLTRKQAKFIERIQSKFGNAQVDEVGTAQARRIAGAGSFVSVIAWLPGSEVRNWVLDVDGDVVLEGGAEPE